MTTPPFDHSALLPLLPEATFGRITAVTPITTGLSGAGVFALTSERGEFVLRVDLKPGDAGYIPAHDNWSQLLLVMRRAAARGVAPAVVHVDDGARAVVMARIVGVPLHLIGEPAERESAIASTVAQLRALHALDAGGIAARDPVEFTRGQLAPARARPGFPAWARQADAVLDRAADLLARDPRRVFSHNDVNPGNVMWDGTRAWLVDWTAAGLGHPYYDLAGLATFRGMDAGPALQLLEMQEQGAIDAEGRAMFTALRRVVGLAVGSLLLGMMPDLSPIGAMTLDQLPTLAGFFTELRAGRTSLQAAEGRMGFALALLRYGLTGG